MSSATTVPGPGALYAPPSTTAPRPTSVTHGTREAAQGRRLLNYLIDGVAATWLMALVWAPLTTLNLVGYSPRDLPVALFLGYYFVCELVWGRTLGKWITGTRVVTLDDRRPGAYAILVRTLARFVPFNDWSFLLARRGWHDAWSKTKVVVVR